jgi:geranylgeranyl reductase family protein
MWDVVIAGAGPAGTIAATTLARAGARVLLVDRARFPRDKLCGDSINPGTVALLHKLHLSRWIEARGLPIEGILLSGPSGCRVEGRYPRSRPGRMLMRAELDHWLLERAIDAGAQFEEGVTVRRPLVESRTRSPRGLTVNGIVVNSRAGGEVPIPARVTIGADGRRSILASALRLSTRPSRPLRWAVGAHFENFLGTRPLVEMHIRNGEYIGLAPLGNGLTNICLVTSSRRLRQSRTPELALRAAIGRDPDLRDRFARARPIAQPRVLGPLAVDVETPGTAGLLLAGDAAGFIDPITGDGLRFAMQGAVLAAEAALESLATGDPEIHVALARRRREAFAWKWRLNRSIRRLVDSPAGMRLAELAGYATPALIRPLILAAGDCELSW